MRNTLETRLGIFFAVALVAAVLVVEMAGGLNLFKKGLNVRARFDQVQELKEGDPVKMAGVRIGRVERIRLAEDKVEVQMELYKPEMVKTDSQAAVKFVGLLGQNYISIEFGSPGAPPVSENALLETIEQADLASLMSKLENVATGVENLTRSFGGDNISSMLGPFTDFLQENNPRLTAILANMQAISSQIAQGEGTVGRLINEETLYTTALSAVTNLNVTAEEIQLTVGQARNIVDQINSGRGTLGKLATDDQLYTDTAQAMNTLRDIFEKINRGEGSAGKLVNDATLFENAKLTLQKVEKATEGLEDQGPLSVMGVLVNGLF